MLKITLKSFLKPPCSQLFIDGKRSPPPTSTKLLKRNTTVRGKEVVSPVDYPLTVQVLKATADLSSVEDGPLLVEARVAHVVDMKL